MWHGHVVRYLWLQRWWGRIWWSRIWPSVFPWEWPPLDSRKEKIEKHQLYGTGWCESYCIFKVRILQKKNKNQETKPLRYPQVPGDVRSRQDACGGREENGEHAKEGSLWSPPAGHKISSEDVRCRGRRYQLNRVKSSASRETFKYCQTCSRERGLN